MPGSNRRFSGTLEHPPPRRDAMDRRHSNASDISLPDSNHIRQLSQENIEYIPTRCTKITAPKPAANPLQFIKVGPASLYKSAQEQLKKVEEIKKVTKEVRDEAEDWQSNLDNWKSSRRKRQEHIIERVVEVKKFEMEEYDRNRRRSKTFNEMMEERNSRGRKVSLVVFQDDDANDLSDLGISTSSGKSSISEDYGNEDHHNANEREETKGNDEQGTQRRNGVHEEDTSSSVATASSPEPEEYTYERAIQGYVNFAETRVKSRPAVTNNNSEERTTLGVNGEKLSNGHGGKTPPPTPRRPSAAKIEEKLSALEQRRRSGSSTDLHSSDIKKPTISVPKVDINKRRELFERACENNNKPVLPSRKLSGELSSPKHLRDKSSEGAEVKKDNKITSEITSSVKERLSNLEKSAENGGSEKDVEHPKHRLSNGDVSVRERLSHIEGQTLVESDAERVQTNRLSGDLSESIKERLSNLDSACNKDNNKKVTPDRDPGFQEKLANFRNTEAKAEDSESLVNGFDSEGKDLGRPYSPEEDLVYQNKKQQFHRSLDSLDVESSENVCNEVFERVQSLEELDCCNRSRNYPGSTSSTEMMAFSSQGGDTDREDREDSGIHTADVSCSVSQADEPVEDSEIITTISSVVPHLETSSTGADVLHLEVELVNHKQPLNMVPDSNASKSEENSVGHLNVEDNNENKTTGADSVILPTSSLVSHSSLDVTCPLSDDARLNFPEHVTNTGVTDCMEMRMHEVIQEDESWGIAKSPEVIIQEDDSSFQELPDALGKEDQDIQELTAVVNKDIQCIQDQIPSEMISKYDPVFQDMSEVFIKIDGQSNCELSDVVNKVDDQNDQELSDVVNKVDDQNDQELSDVNKVNDQNDQELSDVVNKANDESDQELSDIKIYDQGIQVLSNETLRVNDLGIQELSEIAIQIQNQGIQEISDEACVGEVSNIINKVNDQGVGETFEITKQVEDQIIEEIVEVHNNNENRNIQENSYVVTEVAECSVQEHPIVTNKIDIVGDQETPGDEFEDIFDVVDNKDVQELPYDQVIEVVSAVVNEGDNQSVQELSDIVHKVEDQGFQEISFDLSVEQLSEVVNKADGDNDAQEVPDIVYKIENQNIQKLSFDQSVEESLEVIDKTVDYNDQKLSDVVYKIENQNIQKLSFDESVEEPSEAINKAVDDNDVQKLSDVVYKVEDQGIQDISCEQISEANHKVDNDQDLLDIIFEGQVVQEPYYDQSDEQLSKVNHKVEDEVQEFSDIVMKVDDQDVQELSEGQCLDISDDHSIREFCDITKTDEYQTTQELPEAMKDVNQGVQECSNVPECISLKISSDSVMPISETIEEEVGSTEDVDIQEEQSKTVRTDSDSSLMEESDKATTDSSTYSHSDETVVSTGVEVSNTDIVHDNNEQTFELIGDSTLCMSSNADSYTNLLDSEVTGNDEVPSSDPTSSPDKVCMQNEVSAERRRVFEKIEVTAGAIEDRSLLPTPLIEVPHPITEQIKEMESTVEERTDAADVTESQMEQVNIEKPAEDHKSINELAVEQVPSGAKDSGNGTDEESSMICKTSVEQSAAPPAPQNVNVEPAVSPEGPIESDEVFLTASQIPPLNLSSDVEIVAGLEFPLGPPTSAEPPKEKPPPPPTELSDEEVAPEFEMDEGDDDDDEEEVKPLKRLDSTKRIKKEIRRKRSDFLGIEGGNDDSYLEPELKVAPPPDMTSFLVEEQRSEKQLYRQSICSETDSYHGETTESRDSGVELDRAHSDDWPGKQSFTPEILSAQHSRQNSDIYGTASVTSEEDEIMKKEREIIEILEKEEQWRYRNKASAEENDIGEKLAEKLHQLEQEKMRLEWERAEEENRRQMKENARIEEEMRLKAKEEELRQQENIVASPKRKPAGASKEEFVPSGEALHAERERLRRESEQLLREKETLQLREQQRHWNSSSALPNQHWTHETSPIPQTHLSLQDISAVPTSNVTMYHMASPVAHKAPPFNYRLSLPDLQQEQQMQSPQPLRPVSMMPTPRTNPNRRPQPPIPPAKPLRVVSQEQRERENSIRNSRLPSADSLPQHVETVHHQHHPGGPVPSGQPLSRQTLQALSAVPRSRFISNDMWMQPKKKPENQRSGGREQNYNYQHWLIQEAEHRRITEQQQRNAMSPRKPPSQPPAWNTQTPPRQDKPLPDSIIQTLTQRVQNRAAMQENKSSGVSARRRIEESPCRDSQPPQQQQQQQQHQQQMPHPGHMPASHPALGNGDTQEKMLSVSGKKKCSHCGEELGRGAAMIIESLRLFYHIDCFKCCVCHVQLGDGLMGTDVRVRNNKLHCHNCYSSDDGVKFSCV